MARSAYRLLAVVFAVLFLTSAALQWNDPDPWGWAVLYLAAAAACMVPRSFGWSWVLPSLVGVVSLVWAGLLAPETLPRLRLGDLAQTMKAETPAIESGREMLGLLIVAAWMTVVALAGRRAPSQRGG